MDVTSDTGTIRLPMKLLKELKLGTVALQHGWGHQGAKGLSVASQLAGVNVNILAGDGPDAIEPISGMAHLTGIPVSVSCAAGEINSKSWSGMPKSIREKKGDGAKVDSAIGIEEIV